jgi:hypothetical protein
MAASVSIVDNIRRRPESENWVGFNLELETALRKAFGYPVEHSNTTARKGPAPADGHGSHANKRELSDSRAPSAQKVVTAPAAADTDVMQLFWSHVRGHINHPMWSNWLTFGKFNPLYMLLILYELQRGPCSELWGIAIALWKFSCSFGEVMTQQNRTR